MTMPPRFLLFGLVAGFLLALLPLPYGYYQLLRIAAFLIGGWAASVQWREGNQGTAALWALLAAAYNPILPLHLDREIWSGVNAVSAAAVVVAMLRDGWRKGEGGTERPSDCPREP
jgi:hypothetical protein